MSIRLIENGLMGLVWMLCVSIQGNPDLIIWKEGYSLSRKDFLGFTDQQSKADAVSSFKYEVKYIGENDTIIKYRICCYFVRPKSWLKYNPSSGLLRHEQTHFNIAELSTRKLRRIAVESFIPVEMGIHPYLIAKRDSLLLEEDKYTELYESETDFSKNRDEQTRWNNKVLVELEKLSVYSNPIVEVRKR